jgi:NADPH:quinone reductase-like Zn-dependent oxidoreductase
MILKSKHISFTEAAALPQAGVMALQGIHDYGQVKPGQKIMINGAGGGVGSFAIQLTKLYGGEITGVDRSNKFDFMKSLGADHVIDYEKENFVLKKEYQNRYDLILDVVGHHSIFDYKRLLNRKGKYRMIGGNTALIFQSLLVAPFISMTSEKSLGILAHEPNKNLNLLHELIESGKLKVIVDKTFPLEKTADAFQYFGEGNFKGKVIVTI